MRDFLRKAEGWLIAHAIVEGGRIVTFETPEPLSKKPKIPDVAGEFNIECINIWSLVEELGFKIP